MATCCQTRDEFAVLYCGSAIRVLVNVKCIHSGTQAPQVGREEQGRLLSARDDDFAVLHSQSANDLSHAACRGQPNVYVDLEWILRPGSKLPEHFSLLVVGQRALGVTLLADSPRVRARKVSKPFRRAASGEESKESGSVLGADSCRRRSARRVSAIWSTVLVLANTLPSRTSSITTSDFSCMPVGTNIAKIRQGIHGAQPNSRGDGVAFR